MEEFPDPTKSLSELHELVQACLVINTRKFEDEESTQTVYTELIGPLTDLIKTAMAIGDDVLTSFEPADGIDPALDGALENLATAIQSSDSIPDLSGKAVAEHEVENHFAERVDRLMTRKESGQAIADLAFVGKMELGHKRKRLETLSADNKSWEMITIAASARRCVLKIASALEQAIAKACGHSCDSEWFHTELEQSIRVRKLYARFRKNVISSVASEDEQLASLLADVEVQIYTVMGDECYEELRIGDRLLLREIQSRTAEWLQTGSDKDLEVARNLWQDIQGFVGILSSVSMRAELQAHDRRTVLDACRTFTHQDSQEPFSAKMRNRLAELAGLDNELDLLIRLGTETPAKQWEETLTRLRIQFN